MTRRFVFVCHAELVSGAEIVMFRLVRHALAEGIEVIVAGPGGNFASKIPSGATHLKLPPLGLHGETGAARFLAGLRLVVRWVTAARVLRPVLRDDGTAAVVNSLFALPAVRLAGPRRSPVWLVHDVITQNRQRLTVRLGRRGLRAVAVSKAAAAPVEALGIPVTIVVNGVEWPVEPVPEVVCQPPVVGIMALITQWKGHDWLLEAIALLPDVILEIAGAAELGDNSYADELRTRAMQSDLAGRVQFLGPVDAMTVMRGWDVVVSSSVRPEATPLVVLEAMSLGLPVVGSDIGGTQEVLRGGVGLLVPPRNTEALADAINRAVIDVEFRRTARARGRRRVEAEHNLHLTIPALLTELTR